MTAPIDCLMIDTGVLMPTCSLMKIKPLFSVQLLLNNSEHEQGLKDANRLSVGLNEQLLGDKLLQSSSLLRRQLKTLMAFCLDLTQNLEELRVAGVVSAV